MRDYEREERSTTTVRHSMSLPVNWTDMQLLIRVAVQDMGRVSSPSDDELWVESDGERVSVCYLLTESISR